MYPELQKSTFKKKKKICAAFFSPVDKHRDQTGMPGHDKFCSTCVILTPPRPVAIAASGCSAAMGLDVKVMKVPQGPSLPRRRCISHSVSLGEGPVSAWGCCWHLGGGTAQPQGRVTSL